MANEATQVNISDHPSDNPSFTVASGTAISAGTLLKLSDPRTASATSGTGDIFVGVALADKDSDDDATELAVNTKGIWDMTVNAGEGVTLGKYVSTSGANLIKNATDAEISGGQVVGKALETGSANEVIEVAIGMY